MQVTNATMKNVGRSGDAMMVGGSFAVVATQAELEEVVRDLELPVFGNLLAGAGQARLKEIPEGDPERRWEASLHICEDRRALILHGLYS